jgi:hypothetical protein
MRKGYRTRDDTYPQSSNTPAFSQRWVRWLTVLHGGRSGGHRRLRPGLLDGQDIIP